MHVVMFANAVTIWEYFANVVAFLWVESLVCINFTSLFVVVAPDQPFLRKYVRDVQTM